MRGVAVQLIAADHSRLVQQRVVAEDRAQVAPVTVEIVHTRRRGSAASLEQALARMQRQLAHHQLCLGRGQRTLQYQFFSVVGLSANGISRPIQYARILLDQRINRVTVSRKIAYNLLDEMILSRGCRRAAAPAAHA
jgi:hypothetical protein